MHIMTSIVIIEQFECLFGSLKSQHLKLNEKESTLELHELYSI